MHTPQRTASTRRDVLNTVAVAGTMLAATALGSGTARAATAIGSWNVYYVDISAGSTQAPIQAALDAAKAHGGGHVVLGPGTWTLSRYLTIGANTRLTLTPATILRRTNDASNPFMLMNGTWGDASGGSGYAGAGNIIIEGGQWDVAGPATTSETAGWMGISIWHASDITIRDLTVCNVSNWHAVEFGAVRHGIVDNCRFTGWTGTTARITQGTEAIQLDSARTGGTVLGAADGTACTDITVRDNYCAPGTTAAYGGFPTLVGSHASDARNSHHRVLITGNSVRSSRWFAIHPYGTDQAVVTDNTTDDCFGGIRASYANDGGNVAGYQDLVISGNILRSTTGAGDRGIDVMGGTAATGTVASGTTVTGNVVHGAISAGIRAYYAPDTLISSNTVSDSNDRGIRADFSAGVTITGNTVRRCPVGVGLVTSPKALMSVNSLVSNTIAVSVSADSPGCVQSANQNG